MKTDRKIIRKDMDGYEYAIPEKLVQPFTYLVEAITNAEWDSNEYHELNSEFEVDYACYRRTEYA